MKADPADLRRVNGIRNCAIEDMSEFKAASVL